MAAVENGESVGDALNALLTFCWYQHWTIPRTEVVEYAIRSAEAAKDQRCVAEGLRCKAYMLYILDCYEETFKALEKARDIFQTLNELTLAAHCLLMLGETHWARQSSSAFRTVDQARIEFQALGDSRGVAECMLMSGKIEWYRGGGRSTFETTRQEFFKLGRPLGAAHCLSYLALVDRTDGDYAAAQEKALEARQEYQSLGCALDAARCLINVGWCQQSLCQYSKALETWQLCLDEYSLLGRPLGMAQCLQGLGDAYKGLSRYQLACSAYEMSQTYYERIDSLQGTRGAAACRYERNWCMGQINLLEEVHGS
jgi:tetratricopeptide (TPR) repeat protein